MMGSLIRELCQFSYRPCTQERRGAMGFQNSKESLPSDQVRLRGSAPIFCFCFRSDKPIAGNPRPCSMLQRHLNVRSKQTQYVRMNLLNEYNFDRTRPWWEGKRRMSHSRTAWRCESHTGTQVLQQGLWLSRKQLSFRDTTVIQPNGQESEAPLSERKEVVKVWSSKKRKVREENVCRLGASAAN